MVEGDRFRICRGRLTTKGLDERLRHFGDGERHAVATFEAPIFGCRHQHQAIAAMIGDGDRIMQCRFLNWTDVALKILGRNTAHAIILYKNADVLALFMHRHENRELA
ncbi:MAG: hypothetical protein WDN69_22415 [Aliidongia sp.]